MKSGWVPQLIWRLVRTGLNVDEQTLIAQMSGQDIYGIISETIQRRAFLGTDLRVPKKD